MRRKDVQVGKKYQCIGVSNNIVTCRVIKKRWCSVLEEHGMISFYGNRYKSYGHKWYWKIIEEF